VEGNGGEGENKKETRNWRTQGGRERKNKKGWRDGGMIENGERIGRRGEREEKNG